MLIADAVAVVEIGTLYAFIKNMIFAAVRGGVEMLDTAALLVSPVSRHVIKEQVGRAAFAII